MERRNERFDCEYEHEHALNPLQDVLHARPLEALQIIRQGYCRQVPAGYAPIEYTYGAASNGAVCPAPEAYPNAPVLSDDDQSRVDKVVHDLYKGDHGSLEGAKFQLAGLVQDNQDPARTQAILAQIQRQSAGAPARLVESGNDVVIVNDGTREQLPVGSLGGQPARRQMPAEVAPRFVSLSADDYTRADKVINDLSHGDPGSMEGARTQLGDMINDDPVRAMALMQHINDESQGAPYGILRDRQRIILENHATGVSVTAGFLPAEFQLPRY